MNDQRRKVLERIGHLLNKTTARGATQAEAESAMSMAQRLMDEWAITSAEVTAPGDPCNLFGEHVAHEARSVPAHYVVAFPVIEEIFPVRVLVIKFAYPGRKPIKVIHVQIKLFGDPVSVQAAAWALNYLAPTFRGLWDRYRVAHALTRRDDPLMLGFYKGLADGFLDKTRRARAAQERALPGAGNALAVSRAKLNREFEAATPGRELQAKQASSDAYGAGYEQGRKINLARPLEHAHRKGIEG